MEKKTTRTVLDVASPEILVFWDMWLASQITILNFAEMFDREPTEEELGHLLHLLFKDKKKLPFVVAATQKEKIHRYIGRLIKKWECHISTGLSYGVCSGTLKISESGVIILEHCIPSQFFNYYPRRWQPIDAYDLYEEIYRYFKRRGN